MFKPFLRGLKPTLHISHRGGALLAPENTMIAFRQAVEVYKTDMLELDVRLTKDGHVVVSHDATTGSCCEKDLQIAATPLAELQQLDAGYRFTNDKGASFPFRGHGARIPTMQEVFRAFPWMRFNVDLKSHNQPLVDAFATLVKAEGATDRICCGSESDDVGFRLYRALPAACHFMPREALTAFAIAARMDVDPTSDNRFDVLDMPVELQGDRLVDARFIESVRDSGKWLNVWTIDDEKEMRQLVTDGVGGIMTDRPDLLRKVLSGK